MLLTNWVLDRTTSSADVGFHIEQLPGEHQKKIPPFVTHYND